MTFQDLPRPTFIWEQIVPVSFCLEYLLEKWKHCSILHKDQIIELLEVITSHNPTKKFHKCHEVCSTEFCEYNERGWYGTGKTEGWDIKQKYL